jgi:hypothetical protein
MQLVRRVAISMVIGDSAKSVHRRTRSRTAEAVKAIETLQDLAEAMEVKASAGDAHAVETLDKVEHKAEQHLRNSNIKQIDEDIVLIRVLTDEMAGRNVDDDSRPISYPELQAFTTAMTSSASTTSTTSSSTTNTEFSSLRTLLSGGAAKPSVFSEIVDMTTNTVLSSSSVGFTIFCNETRRYLELANGASADNTANLLHRSKLLLDDLIDVQLTSGVFIPAHYIAVDHATKSLVLAIRSTKSFSDLLTDYNFTPIAMDDGFAHGGMAQSARWFGVHVLPRIAILRSAYPSFRLRIVGHSLGAG